MANGGPKRRNKKGEATSAVLGSKWWNRKGFMIGLVVVAMIIAWWASFSSLEGGKSRSRVVSSNRAAARRTSSVLAGHEQAAVEVAEELELPPKFITLVGGIVDGYIQLFLKSTGDEATLETRGQWLDMFEDKPKITLNSTDDAWTRRIIASRLENEATRVGKLMKRGKQIKQMEHHAHTKMKGEKLQEMLETIKELKDAHANEEKLSTLMSETVAGASADQSWAAKQVRSGTVLHLDIEERVVADALLKMNSSSYLSRIMAILYEHESRVKSEAATTELLAASSSKNYSESNFMYGRTYLTSWLKVFSEPSVQRAVQAAREGATAKPIIVLGSTIGWQAFYSAMFLRLPVLGIEILPIRVDIANEAAQILPPSLRSLVQFEVMDALDADVKGAGIVYLTSLGWDRGLVVALHTKLAAEMADTAIVVANSFGMNEVFDQFVLLTALCVPVSWTPSQKFFVYRKRRPSDPDPEGHSNTKCNQTEYYSQRAQRLQGELIDVTAAGIEDTLRWVLTPNVQHIFESFDGSKFGGILKAEDSKSMAAAIATAFQEQH